MATLRPDQLPAADTVAENAALIISDGSNTLKATPAQIADAGAPVASQSEAEAGVDDAKRMSPLKVKQAINAIGVSAASLASVESGKGAALVGFQQDGSGAIARTSGDKLREIAVSVTDFGASTTTADNTDQIQAAIDFVAAFGGGTVEVPPGKFDFTTVEQKASVRIAGKGYFSRLHSTNTTRLHGIVATGPEGGDRICGLSVENLRLTSGFDGDYNEDGTNNNGVISGIGIHWTRVSQSSWSNLWVHNWSDAPVSLTDCDNCHSKTLDMEMACQGFNIFNDSWNCTFDGLTMRRIIKYVGLNIEGLAAGSSAKPRDCVGTNVLVDGATTYGINLVNAVRCGVVAFAVTGTVGSTEGPGDGLQAYGCTDPIIGPGTSYDNAGRGLDIGPTMDDTNVVGVITRGNTLGGCRVTDGGGIGSAFRVSLVGCKFHEGPVEKTGNVTIEAQHFDVQIFESSVAGAMIHRSLSTSNRNYQHLYENSMGTDRWRVGVDVSTNNGSTQFEWYRDGLGALLQLLANGHLIPTLPAAADNAAAIAGGIEVGALYRTATGEVRVVV